MPKTIGLPAVMAVIMLTVGCSGRSLSLEVTHPNEHLLVPFTATGAAVDEGAVCERGTTNMYRLESMEGETITEDDWAVMFDTAMANEGIAEMYVFQGFSCDDGSGGFTLKFHNRVDFSTFEFEGQQDVGTWVIDAGSGDYEGLSGSGDVTLDWDSAQVIHTGSIETG